MNPERSVNPYAAPVVPAGSSEAIPLGEGERISFRGAVARETIHEALCRSPISYASIEDAEQQLLQKHPELYDENRSGWFDADGLQIHAPDYDIWVRWPAIYSVSVGERLLEVTFANGLSGSLMLEVDQFVADELHDPATQFSRAVELSSDRLRQFAKDWPVFVDGLCLPEDATDWPSPEAALSTVRMQLTSRQNFWSAVRASLQTHLKNLLFLSFGIAAFQVSLFSQIVEHSLLWLILALLIFNTLYIAWILRPLLPLYRGGSKCVLMYEMRLTEENLWMALSSALVRRNVSSYREITIVPGKVTLQRCANGIETALERKMFASEGEWQAFVERFQRAAKT